MNYFKKFADGCSVFCAFMSLIYLFRRFMKYKFDENVEGMKEKIKLFFSKNEEYTHLLLLILALLFITSAIAGRIFARYPHLSLIFTVPPLLMTVDMIEGGDIEEYPMLYAMLGSVAVILSLYECLFCDRADGKRRSAFGGNVVSLFCAAFCFKIWRVWKESTVIPNGGEIFAETNSFKYAVEKNGELMEMKMFLMLALFFFIAVVFSAFFSDIYFIHGFVALPPVIYAIYAWNTGKLTVHPELVVTLCIINFAVRAIPALSGRATVKHKKQTKYQ